MEHPLSDTVTLTGLVATVPFVGADDKVPFTSFRLASNQRYFDRRTSQWVAAETNWYTVTAFRALASNTAASVHKGDRVVVTGRLRIRRWESGGKSGISVDVEADGIGHDLAWGTATYSRSLQREAPPSDGVDAGPGAGAETGMRIPNGEGTTLASDESPRAEAWAVAVPGASAAVSGSPTETADAPF